MGDGDTTVTHVSLPNELIGLKVEKNSRGTNWEISFSGFTSVNRLFQTYDEVSEQLNARLNPVAKEGLELAGGEKAEFSSDANDPPGSR